MFITTAVLLLRLMNAQTPEDDPLMALADTHAPVPVLVTTETDDLLLEALMLQAVPAPEPFVVVHQPTRPPQAQDAELPQ